MAADIPIEGKTVKALTVLSVKRTYDLFAGSRSAAIPLDEERCGMTGAQQQLLQQPELSRHSYNLFCVCPSTSMQPTCQACLQNQG